MNLVTKLLSCLRGRQTPSLAEPPPSEAEYYERLFVRNPDWSGPSPNVDERSRWDCIRTFVDKYLDPKSGARILEAGCGRGWLTNLLSQYGNAMGVEPVATVVEHARKLFPELRFEVGTPAELQMDGVFDLVVSSEVLEHVLDKPAFVADLHRLSKSRGLLIVTTPRAELYAKWTQKNGVPSQPIEQWISTDNLTALLKRNGYQVLESATAFDMGIYQIHACRRVS